MLRFQKLKFLNYEGWKELRIKKGERRKGSSEWAVGSRE